MREERDWGDWGCIGALMFCAVFWTGFVIAVWWLTNKY